MMDDEKLHKQIRDALHDGNVEYSLTVIRDKYINIDFRDVTHDLQTILMKVCYMTLQTSSLQSVLEAILDQEPDVNIQDSWGRTAMMHACISNKPVVIEGLLEYSGADISLIDFEGNSALSYAVQNCDIYTLEDILQHPAGHKLLSVHNAKGQSPYTIAQKCGDKSIIRLFESYLDKTIGLKEKKSRKTRHRDVIKLPPAYSPSPERRGYPSPRERESAKNTPRNSSQQPSVHKKENTENIYKAKLKLRLGNELLDQACCKNENYGKCESAPVTRGDREEINPSLSLTSARLSRRHHRQDCLLQESNTPVQKQLTLPAMCSPGDSEYEPGDDLPFIENSIRMQRRPSISLPDLRNFNGNLVSSGNSTPTTGSRRNIAASLSPADSEFSNDEDDVFSLSYPSKSNKLKLNKRQVTLPDINPRKTTLSSPQIQRKGISSLLRQRKYSNSDEHIQRSVLLQDTS